MTGFSQAVRVASTLNAFYPIGNVDCCTPSVLLSSGEQAHAVATIQHAGCQSAVQLLLFPFLGPRWKSSPLPYQLLPTLCARSFQTSSGSMHAEPVIVTAPGANRSLKMPCHTMQHLYKTVRLFSECLS